MSTPSNSSSATPVPDVPGVADPMAGIVDIPVVDDKSSFDEVNAACLIARRRNFAYENAGVIAYQEYAIASDELRLQQNGPSHTEKLRRLRLVKYLREKETTSRNGIMVAMAGAKRMRDEALALEEKNAEALKSHKASDQSKPTGSTTIRNVKAAHGSSVKASRQGPGDISIVDLSVDDGTEVQLAASASGTTVTSVKPRSPDNRRSHGNPFTLDCPDASSVTIRNFSSTNGSQVHIGHRGTGSVVVDNVTADDGSYVRIL